VLPEGDTIDFVFRWSNNGTLFTPSVTPVWIFGIKDATTPSGDFLVQVNSASANAGVYTFTVPISSAELQAWLATATSQSYAAIQITDTANGIATTPLLCQITANQNDSGTTPTSANGVLNVAAGKTVTFPLTLTFPSAAGTNGQQLTLSNSTTGLLEWAASGSSGITIGTTTANGTAGQVLYTDGSLVQQYAISGTGSVAMTDSPQFTTPSLGVATATSINGVALSTASTGGAAYSLAIVGAIDTSNGGGTIDTSTFGGSIDTASGGGRINTGGAGGYIDTSAGGGSIDTRGAGSIELGFTGTRTTLLGNASGSDKTQTLPNATGNIALTTDITGGTLEGSFTTLAVNGKSLTLGASLATTGTDLPTFAFPSSATARTYTFPTTTATLARTDAAQSFTGTQTFLSPVAFPQGTQSAPSLYFTGDTTTGLHYGGASGRLYVTLSGVNKWAFVGDSSQFASSVSLYWNSSGLGGYNDLALSRSGIGVMNISAGTASSVAAPGTPNGHLALASLRVRPDTVANLPASPAAGWVAAVNDANAPVIGLTVTGGAAAFALVCHNGSAWKVVAI
jgi:hypothetical protein